jgi:uncharacterized protein
VIARASAIFSLLLICICVRTTLDVRAQNSEPSSKVLSAPGVIMKVDVSPHPRGLAIEIGVSAPFVPHGVRLTRPDRLVFDFPGYELRGVSQRIPVDSGPVQELRLSLFQVQPPITRLVVDSKEPLNFEVKSAASKTVIEIAFPAEATASAAATTQLSASIERLQSPEPKVTAHSANSRPTAYNLQAKAKTLNLEELQALEDKAQTGDPEAETTLALAYHDAVLLKKDDAEALRLLHKAADQGLMAAEESLGIFAETGIGINQPAPAEALKWYTKAVEQGSVDAATSIALMYADGIGVPRDSAKAMPWFLRAAEGGDETAQYDLALIYRRGEGVPQDYKESVRWLTAAADHNMVPALLDLGNFYMHPPDGTASNVARAIRCYEKAADLGSDHAATTLGNIFATGAQGKPDYEQSVKWYRKAAEQGQRDGLFGLGVRYALGQGVPADEQEARRLFTAAADQGQPQAQYNLAIMWEEGKSVTADRSLAVHYFQLAADQGLPKAQFRLGRLLAGNRESRSDRVSAYKWLMLAQSVKESSPALNDLKKSMSEQEIAEAEREVDNWRMVHSQYSQ